VPASAEFITDLLESELAVLSDRRVSDQIRKLRVSPRRELRAWDYGAPGESFPCWLVLEHPESNTGIGYCEYGFGPVSPWGLLVLEGKHVSMGMDSGWYQHFLSAYFESQAASELPIWRVFEYHGTDFPGWPISDEASWDDTWREVERLRSMSATLRYHCWQSVYGYDA
jgi:hypothetical protein